MYIFNMFFQSCNLVKKKKNKVTYVRLQWCIENYTVKVYIEVVANSPAPETVKCLKLPLAQSRIF